MSNSPQCYSGVNLCRMRVAQLNSAGAPRQGVANTVITTDKQISIQAAYEVEAGTEFTVKSGCGDIITTFKDCDKLKRVTLTLTVGTLDPELAGFLVGGIVYNGNVVTTSKPIGVDFPNSSTVCGNGVALEAWVPAWNNDQAAVGVAGVPLYWRFIYPKCTFVPGQKTLQAGAISVPYTGPSNPNLYFGNGPANDVPFHPSGPEAYFLDATIPAATCGSTTMTAGS